MNGNKKIKRAYGYENKELIPVIEIPKEISMTNFEKEIITKAYIPFFNPLFIQRHVSNEIFTYITEIYEKEILGDQKYVYLKYIYYPILDFPSYIHYVRLHNQYCDHLLSLWNEKQKQERTWNTLDTIEYLSCRMTWIEKEYLEKN